MSTAAITTTTSNSSRVTGTATGIGSTPADVVESEALFSVVGNSMLAVVTTDGVMMVSGGQVLPLPPQQGVPSQIWNLGTGADPGFKKGG